MILSTILITFGFLLAGYIFFDLIKETKRQTALFDSAANKKPS